MKIKIPTCGLLVFSIWIGLFAPFGSAQNPQIQTEVKGLQFRISDAAKPAEPPVSKPPLQIEELSEQETAAIFRRLPQMPVDRDEKIGFKMRSDTLPPPKTGKVIPVKFPADESEIAPNISNSSAKTLEIERFSPAGNVPLVSDLSVTFSQPMRPVASQSQANEKVPVKLTPEVKGRWRWLGANTLIFDAETRFSMATIFTATVPKGTKSAVGGVLEKDFSWTFSTPPPKIEKFAPKDELEGIFPEYALMAAKFNQEINENEVLPKIKVFAGGKQMPVRSATGEINTDSAAYKQLDGVQPKHWLAFRSIDPLPLNSEIKVVFEKDLPSAEGILKSETEQEFSFKTLTPLRLDKYNCGYNTKSDECEPSDPFILEFNRFLYSQKPDLSLIKIEPAIKDAEIDSDGNNSRIYLRGEKKRNTTYKVTVAGKMTDIFKQPLGKDVTAIFKVGTKSPEFFDLSEDFVTLDPNAKPAYPVYTINYQSLKVKLFAVKPDDYKVIDDFRNSDDKSKILSIGRLVFDKTIKVKSNPDERVETKIDISPALTNGFGHALLIVEVPGDEDETIVKWLQRTNIGLNAVSDHERISVFTSDLRNGKPLQNVRIFLPGGESKTTDESGLVEISLPEKEKFVGDWLIAVQGSDSATLPEDKNYSTSPVWSKKTPGEELRWFVFDDRKMYRPQEQVSIKGYIRRLTGGKFTDIAELGNQVKSVNYVLKDPRNNEIARGTAQINAFGAFDFKLDLPKNINLGEQRLELTTGKDKKDFEHRFQVQEFRRPEFEVSAKVETAAPFFVGEAAEISAEAKYYSGGVLQNAETKWNVKANPTNYTPPNRDDFTFGKYIPSWAYYSSYHGQPTLQNFTGKTDAEGKHRIRLDFTAAVPARPYTVLAEAQIQDVNRQTHPATASLLVHSSTLYVGLRTPKSFVKPGEKLRIETITTDIDGKAVAGAAVSITVELEDWQKVEEKWEEVTVDTQTCQIRSAEDVVSCEIPVKQGGVLRIKASVLDEKERRNESELTVWAAGGNPEPAEEDRVEDEDVEMISDKNEYVPGETAEILVNAPFVPAEGIITLERNGIIKTERFSMNENSKIVQIPIEESYLPNVYVEIDLVGTAPRIIYQDERDAKLPKRPAFANGSLNLEVSTASRKLKVTAEPLEKTLAPGGETKIGVDVKDHRGNAVPNSEVAVVAVDESVLALTNYKIENPLDAFYQNIDSNTTSYHSRENVLLSYPDGIEGGSGEAYMNASYSYGMGDGSAPARIPKGIYNNWLNTDAAYIVSNDEKSRIRIRRNFDALAIFSPSVVTDTNGKATVDLKLPDNLTRYRITAVAVTKSKQFGLGESAVTAKQLLQVRPSAPRFMNFGDRAELPVVVQNQTDSPLTVNVAVRANNANLTGGNGRKVTVPANDRAEIRFPVSTEKAGTALFQIGAVSGDLSDAAEIVLPVYTPATSEAFATYGTTGENGAIVQPVLAPQDVFAEFGGLEVTTSSTQLQELTDAFIYLQTYPFACSEQIASRVLSVAAVRNVLQAFDAKDLPSKAEIETKMKADIARLQTLQHADGGWSFWRSDDESFPFVSVHAAHALARAKAKGYTVPDELIQRSLNYLKNIETKFPKEYSEESRRAISAYALYARDLFGETDAAKAKKLLQEAGLENHSPETLGWILAVLANDKNSAEQVAAIKQSLLNRVTETAGNAHFMTGYKDGEYVLLSSERRADAVILEALLRVESGEWRVESGGSIPSAVAGGLDSLIPKIVRGLLANRTKGHWQSTQENVFVLLALDKYFQTFEQVTPNFVARVWLGNAFAGEQKFTGRSTDSNLLNVPMNYLQKANGKEQNLILDKQGGGRLYYRIGLKYAPKNLNLAAADYGFAVSRTYEAIDKPDDVKQNADGSWMIRSGARVRVNVRMVAPTRRFHVALVDNLPAGFEIINPELAVSGNSSINYSREQQRRSFWYSFQNLRDNRAEAFTALLPAGVWNYSYLARATTPGHFIVPPARAEEMYAPETFGRSKTEFVRVE